MVVAAPRRRTLPAALSLVTLTVIAAVAAVIGFAAPAGAHDRLVSSDPADGAALDAVPAAITLTFNDEVLGTGAQVVVTAGGADVAAQPAQVEGTTVVSALPPDAPGGAYHVAWRVVSADGHPIEGTFAFTVATSGASEGGPAAADPPAAADATEQPSDATADPDADASAGSATGPTGGQTEPADAAAGPGDAGSAGGSRAWVWGVVGAAVVATGAASVVGARRRRTR
ncbi:copper resistance protein CopC [Xylanimonas allomyrinae]|uniref:Copper resistance protein CopC n=1 Tax=Xylanimonas allomyrinae TaxID=2509459 RepID=A0A4P6EQ05_9MICO|nr:copper resistance CopC family protein [Xylanimonas allomyrinae]QAY63903.1 copper resistance protein CopC [Xylanimonas allomyrinae]